MAAAFEIRTAEMHSTFRDLEQLRTQDMEVIRNLKITVLGLDSVWKGEAQKALVERFQRGEAAITRFHEALEAYIRITEQAVNEAEALDRSLSGLPFGN